MSASNELNSEERQEPLTAFDRLWEATRPPEPSAASWDRLWARVAAGLRETPAAVPMSRTARGPWRWIALAAVAQAAAVLIAGAIYLRTQQAPAASTIMPVAVAAPSPVLEFELSEGQTLFLEVGERGDRIVCRPKLVDTASLMVADLEDSPTDPYADAVAFSMDILNVMEAIDDPATLVDPPGDALERGRRSTSL
jgi:hypothetical protein